MSTLLRRLRHPSRNRLAWLDGGIAIGIGLLIMGTLGFAVVVSLEAYYGWQ